MRYPADRPTVDEIVAVMRHTADDRHGWRLPRAQRQRERSRVARAIESLPGPNV
jgi:hypothetical protein